MTWYITERYLYVHVCMYMYTFRNTVAIYCEWFYTEVKTATLSMILKPNAWLF